MATLIKSSSENFKGTRFINFGYTSKSDLKNFSYRLETEDGGYVAQCIELDIASQGDTEKEATLNLKEALELYFEDSTRFMMTRVKI